MDRPEFNRLAESELNEAAQYYDREEPGLGIAFLEEVDRCLQFIQEAPEAGSDTPRDGLAQVASPLPIRAAVQDQAERHPDPRRDESQAPPYLLARPRVRARSRPSITAG